MIVFGNDVSTDIGGPGGIGGISRASLLSKEAFSSCFNIRSSCPSAVCCAVALSTRSFWRC